MAELADGVRPQPSSSPSAPGGLRVLCPQPRPPPEALAWGLAHEEAWERLGRAAFALFSASLRSCSVPGNPTSVKEEACTRAAGFPFQLNVSTASPSGGSHSTRSEAIKGRVKKRQRVSNFSGRATFLGGFLTQEESRLAVRFRISHDPSHYRQSWSLRRDPTRMFTAEILLQSGKRQPKVCLERNFLCVLRGVVLSKDGGCGCILNVQSMEV